MTKTESSAGEQPRGRLTAAIAVLALLSSLFVLAHPRRATADSQTTLTLSTTPALYPAFSADVTDYVVRCTSGQALTVDVQAPAGDDVAVDGQPAQTGTFSTTVTVNEGQAFPIAVTSDRSAERHYYVRCLPSDFPTWATTRSGTTQAEYYLIAALPPGATGPTPPARYVVMYDANGVPVWWERTANAIYARPMPAGDIAWVGPTGAEEHALNGALVKTINAVGSDIDIHELRVLPNGNYLMLTQRPRSGVDFSSWGGPSSGTLLDQIIQEVTPAGSLVWSWDAGDHVPVSETAPEWRPTVLRQGAPYDAYHINSIEADGTDIIVSFRHLDAIFRIDRPSGDMAWKLGGTAGTLNLTVENDPVFTSGGSFSGQHDARVLDDGSITLHDNGTMAHRPPRAVRYRIDTSTRSATLLEDVRQPGVTSSLCCGSARRLPGGDWVASWGLNPIVAEMDGNGSPVFQLKLPDNWFSYRAEPILPGVFDRAALRGGMNAQNPFTTSSSMSTVMAAPSTVVADGASSARITVALRDANGNVVPGHAVSLTASSSTIPTSTAVSDDLGNAVFTVTDQNVESVEFSATDTTDAASVSRTANVDFVVGPPSSVTSSVSAAPGSVVADGSSSSTVTVTLKDAQGRQVANQNVTLLQGGGHSVISPASGATDADGMALFTVADTHAEPVTYSVAGVAQTASVSFVAGPVSSSASSVSASPGSVVADGSSSSAVTVTLRDGHGNPVPGQSVSLVPSGGHSVVSPASGVTDGNGVAGFAATDTRAESVIYSVDGVTSTANVSFVPGPVSSSASSVVASPGSVVADGLAGSAVTVTLRDGQGNPVAGQSVSLVPNGGHSSVSLASGVTDGNGVATFTVTDTHAESVTYSVAGVAQTASVSFVPGPVSSSVSSVVAAPGSVVADGSSASAVTVTLRDGQGNPVAGQSVSLVPNGGQSSVSLASGPTDGNGVATFTVTDTHAESVNYAVDGVTSTASVSFVPGAPAGATSSITADSTSLLADGTAATTLTLTMKDANGNPVIGYAASPASGGGHASIEPASAVTDGDGLARFQARDTTPEVVSFTTGVAGGNAVDVRFVAPPPAAPAGTTASQSATSLDPNGTATTTAGGSTATAAGDGSLTLASYGGNPAGPSGFASAGRYFDLKVAAGSNFTKVDVKDCDLNGGTFLEWWDPAASAGAGAWKLLVGDPGASFTDGPLPCLSFTLTAGSTPSIAQLTGTIFAVGAPKAGPQPSAPPDPGPGLRNGYRLAGRDGGVFAFGESTFLGSLGALHLNGPIVGMAETPTGNGYWLVAADGGVFAFGDAPFAGSLGALRLNAPIVGMASTATGHGYWLVAADGGVFAFGDATFAGSLGALHLNAPIVGMAPTATGQGYWLVAADGGIFTFGDAGFLGSMGGTRLASPVVGMAARPDGRGYWLVGADGGVFTFGAAPFFGSLGNSGAEAPVVGIATSSNGEGYLLTTADGDVRPFGTAPRRGSLVGRGLSAPIVAVVS